MPGRHADPVVDQILDYVEGRVPWPAATVALNPATTGATPFVVPGTPGIIRLGTAEPPAAPTAGSFQPGDLIVDRAGTARVVRSLYEQTVRNLNPSAYWRMNDTGSTLVDQMGLYNGTLNGGITTGQAGALTDGDAAMALNGISGTYVSVPSFPAFTAGPFTIALWAKIPTFSSQRDPIAMADATATNYNFEVSYSSATVMRFRVGATQRTPSGAAFDDNLWHLWLFICDASGGLGIYKDNGVFGAISGSGATPQTTGVQLAIGRLGADPIRHFDGGLDEIAIFPSALSTTDRDNLYNAAIASFPWAFEPAASLTKAQTFTKPQTFQGAVTLQAMPIAQAGLELTKIAAPAAPAAGLDRLWVDSTTGALSFMGSDGQALPVAAGIISTPRTYGGVGNGVADDTAALNSAYGAAGESLKNMLYIPGGSWKHTAQLAWNAVKDVLVYGAGIQVTELKPTAFGGSSILFGPPHTAGGTEIGHLGITGPGTYANPNTNPGNTAGVDGLELAGAITASWVRVQGCGSGIIFSNNGGHHRVFHSQIASNYYNVYCKYTGGDDFLIDVQNPSAMFASFYTDDTDVAEDLGFSLGVIRVHVNAQPFIFYQAALTTKSTFVSDLFAHHLSIEQVGNAAFYCVSFATKGNAYGLHFVDCGTMGIEKTFFRRGDSPSDYQVVIGQSNSPAFFWGWPPSNQDKGFMFSQTDLFADWHFYGVGSTGGIFNMNGGDGHAIRWHHYLQATQQGSATFGAASGNNATKAIGSNNYPGPPASVSLQIAPTTDGGLTNGFLIVGGTVRSSPQLQTPNAPVAALLTSAGNIDAGSHSYKVTFENGGINGQVGSSGGGAASNAVTSDASHAQTTVTLPTNGLTPVGAPTATMSVWRNKVASQASWFLVQSGIALGTASITDNLADASLGAAMPTTNTSAGWDATCTLKTTAAQTGNPTFNHALRNQ